MPISVSVPGLSEEIEFPDGTAPDVIKSVIKRRLSGQQQPQPRATTGLPGASVDYLREPNQGKVAGESKRMGAWDALKSGAIDVAGGAMRGAETLGALALDVASAPIRRPKNVSEFLSRSTDASDKWDRWTDAAKVAAGVDPALNELYEGNAQINRLGGEVLGDPSGAIKVGRIVPKAAFAMDDAVRASGEQAARAAAEGVVTKTYSPNPSVERALVYADEMEQAGRPDDASRMRRMAREFEEMIADPSAKRSTVNPALTESEVVLDGTVLDSRGRLKAIGPEAAAPPGQAAAPSLADEAVAAPPAEAPKPKIDPVVAKQVRHYIKKNGITDRDEKLALFRSGLTDEQKATLVTKKLPPVEEVGYSRFYTTTPDKMRDDLGESGMKAWRALDERNFLHETRQVRDERVVRSVTKGWSEKDHIDAFDYRQRARYGLDPAREATIRPEVKKAVDDVLGPMLDRQAKEISEAGIKVPVDSPGGGREWMQFVPIEEGYAPWYRMGDVDAPGLEPKLAARYRLPDASRTRVMARDEAIAPEELDRHFGNVLLRYFDETNELIATAKAFGNQPANRIDEMANAAFAEGKDGFYIREALDLALNGGPTLPQMERKIIKNLAQITVNLTLPFSGPAQLGQLGPPITKAGLVNTMRGIGTALKSIRDGEVRDALVRSAATFESAARGLHEGRTAKGILGKAAAATLNHPLGVTPLDKLSRYLSAAIGKNYAEDLAKVVRGESVGWYNDLKLSPEVAARELGQMGINPKELAKRELTPDDYDRIIWHFAGDTNLRQRPEYMSLPWQRGPWGKLMGILTRFGMQQWPQFKREVWRPLTQQHRVGPALRWAAATPALGYANKRFGDVVYNRDTDEETPLGVAAELYAAGIFGMLYQMALATKYGAEGVFSGAALNKVADIANAGGSYAWSLADATDKSITERDPAYLAEAARKPLDDASEGKGPLVRAAKIHPLGNAAIRHAQDPERSLILNPRNPFDSE